jgi:hypothetical protein
MNWTIPSRTLIKHAGKLAAAFVLYACLRQVGFYNLTAREAEGLGVLIQLVGDIYAVLLAFMIFVIWGQFTDVENCVIRECDSVDDLLRFSVYLNAEAAPQSGGLSPLIRARCSTANGWLWATGRKMTKPRSYSCAS